MHPVFFDIPGTDYPVRAFGVMVVAGFLVGANILTRLGTRYSSDPAKEEQGYAALPVWILIGIMLGARAFYVIVEVLRGSNTGQGYLDNPFRFFAIWEGGLVMYGGFAGGILSGLWCARKYGLRPLHGLDIAMPAAFVGLAIGRIGCLLVGDDYGKIVPAGQEDLPLGIVIRVPENLPRESLFGLENAGQTLWATQIWMSVDALAIALFAWLILRNRRYVGQVTLWTFFVYSFARSAIEHFRGDTIRGLWFGDRISTSQLISLAVGVVCLALLVKNRGRSDPLPDSKKVSAEGAAA